MGTNISFRALPQSLQKTNIYETNYKGITEIIKDAGLKAGIPIKTSSHQVFDENKQLFDIDGHVKNSKSTKELIEAYSQFIPKGHIITCADFRDAVANSYKERLKDPVTKPRKIDLIRL